MMVAVGLIVAPRSAVQREPAVMRRWEAK
jgi:hypothetical protein